MNSANKMSLTVLICAVVETVMASLVFVLSLAYGLSGVHGLLVLQAGMLLLLSVWALLLAVGLRGVFLVVASLLPMDFKA